MKITAVYRDMKNNKKKNSNTNAIDDVNAIDV